MKITNIDYGMSDNSYNIYFSGCSGNPKCKGCFNPENWSFDLGEPWLNYVSRIKKDLEIYPNLINKIILVGGEPLDQNLNQLETFLNFLIGFKKDIFLFTRYSFEDVPEFVKSLCDYIKCGEYIPELTCNDNIQYGIKLATSNQAIYKCSDL